MHRFSRFVIQPEYLLKKAKLQTFIYRARKLAESPEAIETFEVGNYKEYQSKDSVCKWSPKFFGEATEFLAECFFEEFGSLPQINIQNIKSLGDYDDTIEDSGVDHTGQTILTKRYKGTYREAVPGAPVYIQTKGTTNSIKEYKTNDGSRLPNFFMNASAQALLSGHAYQARYIIFTTGSKFNYKLEKNSGNIAEVINYTKISKLIDNNEVFFNRMRRKCGISEVNVPLSKKDQEALDITKRDDEYK